MKPGKLLLVSCILSCLLAGCSANRDLVISPTPSRDLIVLMPDPDGEVGSICVTNKGGTQVVDKPGYVTQVEDFSKPPTVSKPVDQDEFIRDFGPALSAQPDVTGRFMAFILYFLRDTTRLTHESSQRLPEIVRTIKNRNPIEIYVVGHTDRVGTDVYNLDLSSRRASCVRDLLVSKGIKPSSLVVSFQGETKPLVYTEDEIPEPRNRRVEVIVR